MIEINDTTVVVTTFTELKTILEQNNNYSYIYIGNNITMTSGITISATKTNLIIDGFYQNNQATLEDRKSTSTNDTIIAKYKSIQKVTVKNLNITGYNYYGTIYVPEDESLSNLVLEFSNIIYTGPQITFHPTGLTRFINSSINIITAYATANEVAECNRIELGGNTKITHNSTIDTMFWFRGNNTPYLKIMENAIVTLNSPSRELFYGTNNLDFTVEKHAILNITTKSGMGYNGYSTNNVLIEEYATVFITQTTNNGGYATWYTIGPFTMKDSSSLIMKNNFTTGNNSNYNLYFRSQNASFTLNNPKSLVLYNNQANVLYADSSIPFSIKVSRINLWNQAKAFNEAGTLEDIPNYSWYKSLALIVITGTIQKNTTTITSNNLTTEDLESLPALSQFNLLNKKAISIGSLALIISPIDNLSLTIKGIAEKNADILITIKDNSQKVTASDTGDFEFTVERTLAIGTKISFLENVKNSFLYQSKEIQIIYSGELTLNEVPKTISFLLKPISFNPILCPRKEEYQITVTDTRVNSTDWKLSASINHDLISNKNHLLPNALVFVDNQNITPLTNTPTVVYIGENNQGTIKTTSVNWENNQGILLSFTNNPIAINEEYKTEITWSLEE